LGNLESAAGNLDEAIEYFKKAITIRLEAGDPGAGLLANSFLCLARAYFLRGEYNEAFNFLAQSEALFFRIAGADSHSMAQYESSLPFSTRLD
jgi:tetratricopeptide (TPR) repeat protein